VIPVSLSVTGENTAGEFEKSVSISTNDSRRKVIPLTVAGMVRARVTAFPPRIFFGEVKPDSAATREVTISGAGGRKPGEMRAKATSPLVAVEVHPLGNGTEYKLIARLQALRPGITVRDSISVYLGSSTVPAIDIPLYAKVMEKQAEAGSQKSEGKE
jgi:hypothetical protein